MAKLPQRPARNCLPKRLVSRKSMRTQCRIRLMLLMQRLAPLRWSRKASYRNQKKGRLTPRQTKSLAQQSRGREKREPGGIKPRTVISHARRLSCLLITTSPQTLPRDPETISAISTATPKPAPRGPVAAAGGANRPAFIKGGPTGPPPNSHKLLRQK
jgi:hypothetical protein